MVEVTNTQQTESTAIDAPIGAPFELPNDHTVIFKSHPRIISRFCVQVTEPCVVRIKTWRESGESYPKMFVAIDNMRVSAKRNLFKSIKNRENSVLVYPEDPKFKTGVWHIAIEPHKDTAEQIFGVKVTLEEARPVTILDASVYSATVRDSLFFKYGIKDKSDFENALLLLNLSKKEHLEVYIGKNSYPSASLDEHLIAVGSVPDHVLKVSQQRCCMLELLQDLTPFKFEAGEDKVKYLGSFRHLNPDLFKPEHQDKLDSTRVARYTTWTPERGSELSQMTPFRQEGELRDSIDLVLSAAAWSERNAFVNIGVYNRHPDSEPVTFEIQVREQSFHSCLSADMAAR